MKKTFLLLNLFLISSSILQAQNNLPQLSNELAKSFVITDTVFNEPFVDVDEWRDKPVRHRYVHGGFKGTGARFSFYFPPKEKYEGHFFQYITPFPDNENLSQTAIGEEDRIGFSVSHGAYFIETNEGGAIDFSKPQSGDATIAAYRANAASAEFSRVVAAQIYGGKRPYGYCFGGSGGAYRTVGGIENTDGVWDGAVPYVLGSPMAIPNVFTVRMYAMRVLHDKFTQIIDALEPGGSGDMYAGLNTEEKEALQEVTKMGFPPRSWFGYKTMGIHGFLVLYQGVVGADRKYFDSDFWNKPGYLGYNPPASLLKARIQKVSKIKAGIPVDEAVKLGLVQTVSSEERGTADAAWKAIGGVEGGMPVAFQLQDTLPNIDFLGGDLIIRSGAAAGKTLQITKLVGDKVVLGPADAAMLALLKPGDDVQVDNSNFLAVQTYHRHQLPPSREEYPVYEQFRDKDGKPIYPQRPMLLGPLFTKGAAGVLPTGKFKGKMILLESLMDREAFAWQADWYRSRVKEALGDSTDNHFRLWYTDHALHGDIPIEDDPTRTISYLGILQQALLDLSAWVEKGIAPAATTNYKIVDGQVVIPPKADERKGIQPVVTVKASGGERADVKVGQLVTFTAEVEVPKNMGKVVAAAWHFEGVPDDISKRSGWSFNKSGTFPVKATWTPVDKTGSRVTLKTTYTFTKPGTYFPTLRVASQRQGDAKTPFTRIQNLDRVRVVVQ
jgi:hypothetical protein